ncbi:apoptosis regulator BAX-like [Neoarius graeffei]|uniref:apoptosis regulator BAX-like n=1 Tax=Neoarius graeffei TaxID=443677 RepID=UPI00298C28FA|nr:apoptosis regulator BAX-like [Neoarius graeffei]
MAVRPKLPVEGVDVILGNNLAGGRVWAESSPSPVPVLNCCLAPSQIDGLAHLGDKKIFPKLVEGIFSDGQINWGRIAVLFYTVGRLAVKMVLADSPTVLSEILDSCLHFFRTKLLPWIRNMGGWISSISALTRFSIEHNSASSSCAIRLPAPLIMAFVCGVLLGSVIAWKLNRSS